MSDSKNQIGAKALEPFECCKICVPLGFDLTKILPLQTFSGLTETFNRCLPHDNVSKFYSVFLMSLLFFGEVGGIFLFQWSVVEKKNGTKKVGHINLSHALD